jgi:HK97 family phage major capsid protein
MHPVAKLKQDRAAKLAEAKELNAKADATAEDTAKVDALLAECDALAAQIDAAEKAEAEMAERAAARAAKLAALDEQMAAVPEPKAGRSPIAKVRDMREDDPRRGFRSLGDFGAAVMGAAVPGRALDRRLGLVAAATGLQQGVGPDGGFLVPPEFSSMIWDGLNKSPDNLLSMTDQYTVSGESLTFNANAETSRATGSRWGGIQGYWISEAAQITSSKPTFRQVKIEPQQLAVLCYATDKLLANTAALDQYLGRAAQDEIMFLVNDAIINGNGVGKPKGILNSACRVAVSKETGQAAATIVKANIDKMWSRMHPQARANAVWFINVDTEPQLEQLSQVVGTGGVPVYLPPGGIADTPNARLKGRPVMPIEACATLGTEGDIILADMRAYVTGLKGGIDSAMSMHLRFDYAETAFRFMFSADGQPWLASAITPFKGSNTLSPFVTLATRS